METRTKLKGVILCGGQGTRLRPATLTLNKHLIPILNEPMVLFPLRTLKRLGVEDILIVTGGDHVGGFAEFLGDGSEYGVTLTYKVQTEAGGIAQALSLARGFCAGYTRNLTVILGDNIYDNDQLVQEILKRRGDPIKKGEAALFLKEVPDPRRFGVAEVDGGKILNIEEKPVTPKSNLAVTGLYMYPPSVFDVLPDLKPSARGELEISDINNHYIKSGKCTYFELNNCFWSDAGTPESLYEVTRWEWKNRF